MLILSLLLITLPWILKAYGTKSELLRKELEMFHHLPQYTFPLLSVDHSCQSGLSAHWL